MRRVVLSSACTSSKLWNGSFMKLLHSTLTESLFALLCASAVIGATLPTSNRMEIPLTDAEMAFSVGDSSCPAGNSYVQDPKGCVVAATSTGCAQAPGLFGWCCVVPGPAGTYGCALEISSLANGAGTYVPDVPAPACAGNQTLESCNCSWLGYCYSFFTTITCGNRVVVVPTC
jgi:hypothetical protein